MPAIPPGTIHPPGKTYQLRCGCGWETDIYLHDSTITVGRDFA